MGVDIGPNVAKKASPGSFAPHMIKVCHGQRMVGKFVSVKSMKGIARLQNLANARSIAWAIFTYIASQGKRLKM